MSEPEAVKKKPEQPPGEECLSACYRYWSAPSACVAKKFDLGAPDA
jgi:hypothetical protein